MYTYGVRECIYTYIYTHKETEIKIYFKELTHMDEAGNSKIHRLVQQAGNSGRFSAFQLQGRIPSSLGKQIFALKIFNCMRLTHTFEVTLLCLKSTDYRCKLHPR